MGFTIRSEGMKMKRTHFYWLTFLVVLLIVGISMVSMAEEPVVLKIEISDYVSNTDARQIRRLLKPWADPKNVTFSTPVDKNGRKRHFTTVVEVKPRHGVTEYSETHTFDVYDICLLYTSPSPRDGLLSRMPSSA